MKLVYNDVIPFPGFKAINLFGVCFVRRGCTMSDFDVNHEKIHTAQMKELWYVGFYVLYVLEWLYRMMFHWETAYSGLSFEREAYGHQYELGYLENRKRFAMWKK